MSLDDADDAPGAVIVDRRPLAGLPHEREERERSVGRQVNGIPRVVFRIGTAVFGREEV